MSIEIRKAASVAHRLPSDFWSRRLQGKSVTLGRIGLTEQDMNTMLSLVNEDTANRRKNNDDDDESRGTDEKETQERFTKKWEDQGVSLRCLLERIPSASAVWEITIGVSAIVYRGRGCKATFYLPSILPRLILHEPRVNIPDSLQPNMHKVASFLQNTSDWWREIGFWPIKDMTETMDGMAKGDSILLKQDFAKYLTGEDLLTEYTALLLRVEGDCLLWGGEPPSAWTLKALQSLTADPLAGPYKEHLAWLKDQQILRGLYDKTGKLSASLTNSGVSLSEAAVWSQELLPRLVAALPAQPKAKPEAKAKK